MTTSSRVVVLGFDGLDFAYLDRYADALPNFGALRDEGAEAPLRSTHPPWTGSAWPSMYTGTDPGTHGVYSFFDYTDGYPDEGELHSRNTVQQPAIWNYLTDLDVPSIVLNVPVTHPAEPIEGVLVPGYLAPESASGHPEGIREDISEAVDEEYRIYSEAEMADDPDEKLDGYLDLIRLRSRSIEHLLETHDWEVAIVQVQKTDTVFHNFDDDDVFREVYRAADEVVGTVREIAPDANYIVCSDHGMGPSDGYQIYLNEVLRDHGFVETTASGGRKTLAGEKSGLTEATDGGTTTADTQAGGAAAGTDADRDGASADGSDDALLERVASWSSTRLDRAGVTPGQVYGALDKVGLGDVAKRVVPESVKNSLGPEVDWANSIAYARTGSELGVRINLEGREPAGVVSQSEYEDVRQDLIDLLSGLKTPDGEPAFELVARREEVYEGPFTEDACDVAVRPTEMNHTVLTSLMGTQFLPTEGYDHQIDGTFVAAGPDVADDATLDRASLTDVAPTVMALAGFDIPERMTGEVPDGLVDAPVLRRSYDVEFGTDREGGGSEEQVKERLSDLGYF